LRRGEVYNSGDGQKHRSAEQGIPAAVSLRLSDLRKGIYMFVTTRAGRVLLLAFLITAIISPAAFAQKPPKSPKPKPTPTPAPVVQVTPYVNKQYGISFVPPEGWYEEAPSSRKGTSAVVSFRKSHLSGGESAVMAMWVKYVPEGVTTIPDKAADLFYEGITESPLLKDVELVNTGRFKINGLDVLALNFKGVYRKNGGTAQYRDMLFIKNGKLYSFQFVTDPDKFHKIGPIGEKLLKSVKFLPDPTPRIPVNTPPQESGAKP
jgi:hypothetical protein